MPPVEFEPTISAGERPQSHALDRAATGTGNVTSILTENVVRKFFRHVGIIFVLVHFSSRLW
jgi:hypothetical protein